jgi:hypothetical protein
MKKKQTHTLGSWQMNKRRSQGFCPSFDGPVPVRQVYYDAGL